MTKRQYKTYKKVQHELYVNDARMWCEDNGVEYDADLLEAMADYVSDRFDCNLSYWDNFAKDFNFDGIISDKDGFKIKAAFELGKRFGNLDKFKIESPSDIFSYVRHYSSHQQEHFIAIMLNGNHEVIGSKVITIGLLNRTVVHPREVFAPAIEMRAAAIAIVHNHPSGNLEPSEEDKLITNRLVDAAKIVGIQILDHVIFSNIGYYSFLEHGLI